MLDKNTGALPPPSTCERDQGAQRLVSSRRSVPFLRIGGVACIEVMGIPALQCQVCDEQIYDLTLLAQIERALHGRVTQGSTETQYTFEQLATELLA